MRLSRVIIAALAAAPLLLPLAAHATGIPFFGPIVPDAAQNCPAGWGSVAQLINNILAFAMTMVIVVAAPLSVAWGGFLYLTSGANPGNRGRANGIFLNTLVGTVIALSAWLIVDTILTVLVAPGEGVAYWTSQMFNSGDACLPVQTTTLNQAQGQTQTYLPAGATSPVTTTVQTPDQACANHGGLGDQGDVDAVESAVCKDGTVAALTTTTTASSTPGVAVVPGGDARFSARPGINLNETPSIAALAAILTEASKALPEGYSVVVTTTTNHNANVAGGGGVSQHTLGKAMDIQILGPDGPISNRGADTTGYYTILAKAAAAANTGGCALAWGGCFDTGKNSGVADLMHFDCGGDRGQRCTLAQIAGS